MKPRELEMLHKLAQRELDRDASQMKRVQAALVDLQASEDGLAAVARDQFPATSEASELLAYSQWLNWSGRKRQVIGVERAEVLKAEGAARAALRKSFGKTEAVGELKRKAQDEALLDERRKAEQNGQVPER